MTALHLSKKYRTLLNRYDINTPIRKAMFFAQLSHESGLEPIEENLNYSTKRLMEVFKYRLDRDKNGWLDESEKAKVREIAGNPQKIGSFVYANRMGNGDEKSGEGYKYRGRGYLQITGKDNYKTLSKDTGINYVNNPDLLLTEADSMIAALWFFKKNNLNKYADQGNIDTVSDLINIGRVTSKYGDSVGFSHRKQLFEKYKKVFGA